MKSLIQRLLVSTAIAIVSLGSAGHAMAASTHHTPSLHHKAGAPVARTRYRYHGRIDVAAIPPYPDYSSSPAWAPHSRAGYEVAADQQYSRLGSGYPVAQWGGGYPVAGAGVDVRGLITALLGGVPLHYGGKGVASGSGSDVDYSPAPDTSAADAAGWAAEQAANDASAAAIQQEDANLQALDQSISAAEQQNDAANAATQQYLINNGM
jgi:hypothetical protein